MTKLGDALDRLPDEEHWTQQTYAMRPYKEGRNGAAISAGYVRRCLIGALYEVQPNQMVGPEFTTAWDADPDVQTLAQIIREHFPARALGRDVLSHLNDVTGFNDHDETTFEDVRLVAEKAAIKADEEGL